MGGCTVANGMLTVKPGFVGRTIDALLALPANATATKLRVRLAVGDQPTSGSGCFNGMMYSTILSGVMAVVGPNGETSERVTLACDGAMADHIINPPAASPLWLVVHLEGATSQPYYSPSPGLPPVNVDELEFM
jgi:hypothetical protein